MGKRMLRVGTRGSKLALVQTSLVLGALKKANKEVEFEIVPIRTMGDWERSKSLFYLDRKGIFEKEIDQAISNGMVDFGVHSLKDVPVGDGGGVVLASVPKRGSPFDVLVSRKGSSIQELREGAVVGTSSLRRAAEVKHLRPDLRVKPIRGNVDTRLAKLDRGEYDALILAEEGLKRLELDKRIADRLLPPLFLPAAGQGAMGVIAREGAADVIDLLLSIEHPPSRAEVTAERAVITALHGGCRVPIGVLGRSSGERLSLEASIFSLDGRENIHYKANGRFDDPIGLGKLVAEALLQQGAKELEDEWRAQRW